MPGFPVLYKDRFLKYLSHQNLESLGHPPLPTSLSQSWNFPFTQCLNMEKVIINIVLSLQVMALNSLQALWMSRSSEAVFVVIAWNERSTLDDYRQRSLPSGQQNRGEEPPLIPFADGLGAGRMGREAWKTGWLLIVSLQPTRLPKWLSFSLRALLTCG